MELKHYKKDNDKQHEILGVASGSIAQELGIQAGDRLVSINGKVINDALDYHLFVQDEMIDLVIYMKEHDEAWLFEIEKDAEEDLGLLFDNNLMDNYRSCRNKCVFCFIDQLPGGLRETLYFKDDDARLSFLQGNYITLTNMTERELGRVIEYHLSPINISIHTMNPELRCQMLGNRFAGKIIESMDRLNNADITMNGQIVLCKGLNDGQELEDSIVALERYLPNLQSVSVVPVGISKHRDGLYPLESFTAKESKQVLSTIHKWQAYFKAHYDVHFIHAGDEFYIMADEAIPEEDRYDGYLQLENGVGMTRVLIDSFRTQISAINPVKVDPRKVTLVTGLMMAPILRDLLEGLTDKVEGLEIDVIGITNEFFGHNITVSGLLVGQDIIQQLEGRELGDRVYIPDNVLKSDEAVYLDDTSQRELEEKIHTPVVMCDHYGETFIEDLMRDLQID